MACRCFFQIKYQLLKLYLPLEVRIVQVVVFVEPVQVGSELLRSSKLLHVDVRVMRRGCRVLGCFCAHHYRQDVVPRIKPLLRTRRRNSMLYGKSKTSCQVKRLLKLSRNSATVWKRTTVHFNDQNVFLLKEK